MELAIALTAAGILIPTTIDRVFPVDPDYPAYEVVQKEGRTFLLPVSFEDITGEQPVAVVRTELLTPAGYR